MSEYIKREDAINRLADEYVFDARSEYEGAFTRADFIDDAKETLADIPSADVVEVRHGRWGEKYIQGDLPVSVCSVCGKKYALVPLNYLYCPNCGAKMDGGGENDI